MKSPRIEDMSIIIITRNEEYSIVKCLSAVNKLNMHNCEIIVVDSDSTDNTIDVVRSFISQGMSIKLIQVKKRYNAAIGRNVGYKNSHKEYILFLDGDVEIEAAFVDKAIGYLKTKTEIGAVYGDLREIQYSEGHSTIIKEIESRLHITKERYAYQGPGIFMTTREALNKTGLFNESYDRSEDTEFYIRMSKKFNVVAIPVIMGTHHTVPYSNFQRFNKMIFRYEKYFFLIVLLHMRSNPSGTVSYISANMGIVYSIIVNMALILSWIMNLRSVAYIVFGFIVIDVIYGMITSHYSDAIFRIYSHYLYPSGALISFFRKTNAAQYQIIHK